MFKLANKLKIILHEVKGWSKNHFGNLHNKIVHNTQKIDHVEEKLLSNSESFRFNAWMTCLLKQREKMMLFNQNIGESSDGKNGW